MQTSYLPRYIDATSSTGTGDEQHWERHAVLQSGFNRSSHESLAYRQSTPTIVSSTTFNQKTVQMGDDEARHRTHANGATQRDPAHLNQYWFLPDDTVTLDTSTASPCPRASDRPDASFSGDGPEEQARVDELWQVVTRDPDIQRWRRQRRRAVSVARSDEEPDTTVSRKPKVSREMRNLVIDAKPALGGATHVPTKRHRRKPLSMPMLFRGEPRRDTRRETNIPFPDPCPTELADQILLLLADAAGEKDTVRVLEAGARYTMFGNGADEWAIEREARLTREIGIMESWDSGDFDQSRQ